MEELEAKANDIVTEHMWWSAGAGLIPVPMLDLAAISGVQLKMLKNLADHYGVPFSDNLGKSLTGAVLGGVTPGLASGTVRSWIKTLPMVGGILGAFSQSMLAGASTYALGKVFVQHFASGGTFLNFDPSSVKQYFAEQFQKGKALVSSKKPAPTAA